MDKADGAFLTIGELARELGVAQHILRYWETRFTQLRPLQRAGNRRYYRPQDVAVARAIHRLLMVEGFTMKGAAKALAMRLGGPVPLDVPATANGVASPAATPSATGHAMFDDRLARLVEVRRTLADALGVD